MGMMWLHGLQAIPRIPSGSLLGVGSLFSMLVAALSKVRLVRVGLCAASPGVDMSVATELRKNSACLFEVRG